jgi:RNA polymerase sigma factor (TIGR02999 family)
MTTPTADEGAPLDALFSDVYGQLRRLARGQRGSAHDTLNTTALVHELYLQMNRSECARHFDDPRRFYAYAARAMRHLLVDRARERMSQRAGGGWVATTLEGDEERLAISSAEQALQLDAALTDLERVDPRAAHVVQLRYFSGLPLEQVADVLGLARATVVRDWRFARSFLHDRIV